MARNKNRKKSAQSSQNSKKLTSTSKNGIISKKSPSTDLNIQKPSYVEEINSNSKNIQNKADHITEEKASIKTKNLVRLSTCMAGMFLTFLLGLYLGSLLPGIMKGMVEEKELAQQTLQRAPLPTPAPPPAPEAKPEKNIQEKSVVNMEKGSIRDSIPKEILEHIRHLEKDASSHPDDARIWAELGNAYFDIHEPQNAISAYEHSLTLSPSNPDVLTDLGIMYREIKNYDRALECFRKAHRLDPKHINALFNEGVVLSTDLGQKVEAARVWTRILDIDPAATTPNGQKIADMVRQLQ